MKTQPLAIDEGPDTYWYPCSPRMRWLLLFFGLFSIGYEAREWMLGHDAKVYLAIIGLWMVWNTWRPPVLKRKSWVERHIVRLLVGLILAMALYLLLFAIYTWIRS